MAPRNTARTSSKGKGKAKDKPASMTTTREFENGATQHTLNFGKNSQYLLHLLGTIGNHTYWFLSAGANQQPIAAANTSIPSTSNQHLPQVTAWPAQASRHRATIEEVDDEDGPVTPPPSRHVTFDTATNPPSDEDSHSTSSREDFADVFNDSPSPPRPRTPNSPARAPSTPHTPRTPAHRLQTPQTPQTPRRGHGRGDRTPRAGRHSTTRRASGPAGNKKEHKATDVWPFFTKEGNKNQCNFCLYVFKFPLTSTIKYLIWQARETR